MATTRPPHVCLCGSTKFRAEFDAANRALTLAGHIVLAPGVFVHSDGTVISEAEKIDLADSVFVVNPGGYIGDSTRAEIAYATRLGKRIGYLEPIMADSQDVRNGVGGA